jgi:uncharacterized protein (UPF0305 family)
MKIECSIGEVVDKITILELKLKHILDIEKLGNIKREHTILTQALSKEITIDDTYKAYYERLLDINNELWELEEDLRKQDENADFGIYFISNARAVYKFNDLRAGIKREINVHYNSNLIEEKSYKNKK